jgi:prephenate dehydratase
MIIAFQGEVGAFSEAAARHLFAQDELQPHSSFESVFDAVHDGDADRGVVPIENSLHGSVHSNYDLLEEHELRIVGEVNLRIRHNLLVLAGTSIEEITTVESHPQAIGQCRRFLRETLPHARVVPTYDTAGAARAVARGGDRTVAAIASRRAADEYGLTVLFEEIESNHENYTRFLALSRPAQPVSTVVGSEDGFKTSIVYSMRDNVPGALFKSLAVFALREIDLFKIESRPLVGRPGEYLFYLDFAGSEEDKGVQKAIGHLEEIAAYVKILGSYGRGEVVH